MIIKKVLRLLFITLLLTSCFSRNSSTVKYILPLNVEKEIVVELNKDKNSDYFIVLNSYDNENEISLVKSKNLIKEKYGFYSVSNSGRRVLIDDKFYPLMLGTDLKFGKKYCEFKTSFPSLNERLNQVSKEEGLCILNPPIKIYDNAFTVKFNKSGEVIK